MKRKVFLACLGKDSQDGARLASSGREFQSLKEQPQSPPSVPMKAVGSRERLPDFSRSCSHLPVNGEPRGAPQVKRFLLMALVHDLRQETAEG